MPENRKKYVKKSRARNYLRKQMQMLSNNLTLNFPTT